MDKWLYPKLKQTYTHKYISVTHLSTMETSFWIYPPIAIRTDNCLIWISYTFTCSHVCVCSWSCQVTKNICNWMHRQHTYSTYKIIIWMIGNKTTKQKVDAPEILDDQRIRYKNTIYEQYCITESYLDQFDVKHQFDDDDSLPCFRLFFMFYSN